MQSSQRVTVSTEADDREGVTRIKVKVKEIVRNFFNKASTTFNRNFGKRNTFFLIREKNQKTFFQLN